MTSSVQLNRRFRTGIKFVVIIAFLAFAVWSIRNRPLEVKSFSVERRSVVAEVMGTGTLEARLGATISPKIQGRLQEVSVDQNDTVAAGQLMATLDDTELSEQVAVAQATLDAAIATGERVRADEKRALAVLNQAQLSHSRSLDLLKASVAAQADLDKAVELLQVAEADVSRAKAAIVEADRQRLTTEASLKYQQARLADTRLVSPFAGLVVRRDRDPGDVVVPGASVVYMVSTNELWISAWIDETAMAALDPGQPARVVFRSVPEKSFAGKVARLGRQVDRETREFLVDVQVTELPRNWVIGQRAEVFIQTQQKESAVAVPASFVHWKGGAAGVFLNHNGRSLWRGVKTGLHGGDWMEVASGLQEGDEVIRLIGQPGAVMTNGKRIRSL